MPDLTLALGKPVYNETLVSEVRLVNVVEKEANADDNNDEKRIPLAWQRKRSHVSCTFAPIRDQVGTNKGKNKVTSENAAVIRSYTTRDSEKKLLGDAIKSSRKTYAYKKK